MNLAGMNVAELESVLTPLGLEPFRARQIFKWVYQAACFDFERMTDISRATRKLLAGRFTLRFPVPVEERTDPSGTRKVVFALEDGERVEAVFIPDRDHDTVCVSTQAGCALRCAFCVSGARGLKRDLAPGEIIGQFLAMRPPAVPGPHEDQRAVNLVLMGMGEPLLNLDASMAALDILRQELGPALSMRRTTLSTAGVVPGIERLGRWPGRPKLAVSLNATTNEVRSALMPVNKKYPIEALLGAVRSFPLRRGERVTFEYVMIRGVNDTPADARRLAGLLGGISSKVNLIPINPVEGCDFEPPDEGAVHAFQGALRGAGITTMLRRSRGTSIAAACGQLAGAPSSGAGTSL